MLLQTDIEIIIFCSFLGASMKIGFFAFSLTGNGPRTRARTLIDKLADRGNHEIVLVTGPDESYDHQSVDRYFIQGPTTKFISDFNMVKSVFCDVDVVHVPVNLYQVSYVRALYDGPLVAGAGVQHEVHYRNFAKLLNIDHIIETHEFVSYLWERSGFNSTPIYPSIDSDTFFEYDKGRHGDIRQELDISEDQDILLYVGDLNEFKGAAIFAEVIDKMGSDKTAIVAGSGPLVDEFADRDDVRYQGFVGNDKLAKLYNVADVTVVPSVAESFSLVSLESIACGTPVVTTTKDGTMLRLFKNRQTYIWTERRTANAVLSAVNTLLEDEDMYKSQVQRGFETIDEMGLTISDTVDKHLSVYRAAVENR